MEFFRIRRDIPFMRFAPVFNIVSALMFVAAVFFIFNRGLHLSIEFTGGTVMEVGYPQAANLDSIRGDVSKLGYGDVQVQTFGNAQDVVIRLPLREGQTSVQQSDKVLAA
ncbi:MAG: protein translocase subunit SecF, partial [Betaproteobacteria bacterium]|nr:protein translocase subunit SecF [Betaproteobacteria bacterium]